MITLTDELLDSVIRTAKNSPRKRANHNFHASYEEPLQRFLNAAEPDTYIRPHSHVDPATAEIFLLLRGTALVVEFDDAGGIANHAVLDFKTGSRGVEIPAGVWHSFISLREGTVLYEIKQGPFHEDRPKVPAGWAPEEGNPEAAQFNRKILRALNISLET